MVVHIIIILGVFVAIALISVLKMSLMEYEEDGIVLLLSYEEMMVAIFV